MDLGKVMASIDQLKQRICNQVEEFIRDVLRPQDVGYNERREDLLYQSVSGSTGTEDPRRKSSGDSSTMESLVDVIQDGKITKDANNNPLYSDNMIDLMNTPFDHIDRIFLQDFNESYGTEINQYDVVQHVKGLFNFTPIDSSNKRIVNRISMSQSGIDYSYVNSIFSNGKFVVDSFTYTPFIDYSTQDSRIGIYSDDFLTKYNTGWYDAKSRFVDVNRRNMSSELYQLRNLEDDLQTSKVSFRNAIMNSDKKTFIYVFCEHLVQLFAKMSNIRMCHSFCGLKTPHMQWEGILALDIWYQLLYLNIDKQYSQDTGTSNALFNEDYLNRNPMSKLKVVNGKVTYTGREYDVNGTYDNITIFKNDPGCEDGYVLLWDNSMYQLFKENSQKITAQRSDFITPRGVLKRIHSLIWTDGMSQSTIDKFKNHSSGDFDAFYQNGNVYSDSSKSMFSKYVNLHLGRAYDVMTPKEYHDLCGYTDKNDPWAIKQDGKIVQYVKPRRSEHGRDENLQFYQAMLDKGCKTLKDAFAVMRQEKLSQIWNSSSSVAEDFNPQNIASYSQAQCAIVIERIFSRLYKYLSFKSTTQETFERHINIDNGYKYLTTDTLRKSDNKRSGIYYDESNGQDSYLSYLAKLNSYVTSSLLTAQEKKLVQNVVRILSKESKDWIEERWDLCPFCQHENIASARNVENDKMMLMSSRKMLSRAISSGSASGRIYVCLNVGIGVSCDLKPVSTYPFTTDDSDASNPILTWDFENGQLNLSNIGKIVPSITIDGKTLKYQLVGFSRELNSNKVDYTLDSVIQQSMLNGSSEMYLYAIWKHDFVIRFEKGYRNDILGTMTSVVVPAGKTYQLPKCLFYSATTDYRFTYQNDSSTWRDVSTLKSDQVSLYGFSGWNVNMNGGNVTIEDGGKIVIGQTNSSPKITFVATWESKYDRISFKVDDKTYCKVLIDKSNDEIVIPPLDPILVDTRRKFVGWDVLSGTILGGNESNQYIVCGDAELPLVCSGDGDLVICQEDGLTEYQMSINALIMDVSQIQFGITFKFLDEYGTPNQVQSGVVENTKIPFFHLHDEISFGGKKHVFRYWHVDSGNLSSKLTILSPIVLSAVYDVVNDDVMEYDDVNDDEITVLDGIVQQENDVVSCPYVSEGVNAYDRHYCTYSGQSPDNRVGPIDNQSSQFVHAWCPLINELNKAYSQANDFDEFTLMEISDISTLLQALFKINIDIANKEYFLKIDVQFDKDWWYGYVGSMNKWISFEPTVEYKFCNLHAINQVYDGKLLCTVDWQSNGYNPNIVPINRELKDEFGIHYTSDKYCYDYIKSLDSIEQTRYDFETGIGSTSKLEKDLNDNQTYYAIRPLNLYANSNIQSPTDVNDFVKYRVGEIVRTNKQVQTFTSIVKKYRPIIVPNVRDIFNDCVNDYTKYQVDKENSYGVFGWCTIPSKTMVNMQYNEQSIVVPSSYDHHNRVGGRNFLQMDSDLHGIYKKMVGSELKSNIGETWYYLYDKRDWTHFITPFFNIRQNNDIWSWMRDQVGEENAPQTSNHLNGIIFESSTLGRQVDSQFGDIVKTCQYLASHHHNKGVLKTLAKDYLKLIPYEKLLKMTSENDKLNSTYGSSFMSSVEIRHEDEDWVDDFNKTGSYFGLSTYDNSYEYNIGQADAIDDKDENSVWLYITMVEPVDNLEQAIEIEDIMPYVFWWSNRGYSGDVDEIEIQEPEPIEPEPEPIVIPDIQVSKVDDDGYVLAGAKIDLKDSSGRIIWTNNSMETAVISGSLLSIGQRYVLTESKVPEGYNASEDIEVTIDEEGNVSPGTTITVTNEKKAIIKHKLTINVSSFPNGQTINLKIGDAEYNGIYGQKVYADIPAGEEIIIYPPQDFNTLNIKDDDKYNLDVTSNVNDQKFTMPNRDYVLNVFMSKSMGTNFQCKDTSGEYVFQGILQELDEGYQYTIEVPICMIGHYGGNPDHKLKCRLGYQSSDGTTHYFYNDSNGNTIEHTDETNHITIVQHLVGRSQTARYNEDGVGYWRGSQNEDGTWKSDSDIISQNNGLLHREWGVVRLYEDISYTGYGWGTGGTYASFYISDDRDGDPNKCISGPNLNGETFTINPSGVGKCTLGIQVKDGAGSTYDCTGVGAFVKMKVTRGKKIQ